MREKPWHGFFPLPLERHPKCSSIKENVYCYYPKAGLTFLHKEVGQALHDENGVPGMGNDLVRIPLKPILLGMELNTVYWVMYCCSWN
jgi:hypothetical protein